LLASTFAQVLESDSELGSKHLSDESSFANINDLHTKHFDLQIELDFDNSLIYGTQTIFMTTKKWFVNHVDLDVRDLDIKSVTDTKGNALPFQVVSGLNDELGQKLEIQIPKKWFPNSEVALVITYVTSQDASAVSWLTKEQTAGKKLPYMYTQCESIHCRSVAPLQDTPAIKATYTIHAISPVEMVVRASGNITHEYTDEEHRHTKFEMTIPVESYLLAFASGNLVEKQLGKRTFVITEPELMEKCVSELQDLEKAVEAAESYITPYVWGVYKVLMLPPSFPYGGMENPLMTFANSGLVTGDKSSFRLFVHELSHSWFGNLVTNENWSNFWLNEGFTVFLERKTDSILYGVDASKVAAKRGNSSMHMDIENFGETSNYTSLHPEMNGNHPDTSISGIPYEKGFQFLYFLESQVGEEQFQSFLQSYVNQFSEHSLNVEEFIDFFTKFVNKKFDKTSSKEILDNIDWDAWIYQPGKPPVQVDLETQVYKTAIQVAQNFLTGQESEQDVSDWTSFDLSLRSIVLIELLSNYQQLSAERVQKIDQLLSVSSETNPQLKYTWLTLSVYTGAEASPFPESESFVGSIGRYAIIVPVYRAMISQDQTQARAIFEKYTPFYHPITRQVVENLFSAEEVARSDRPIIAH
jgi:leukotriene-A4 hydrolase